MRDLEALVDSGAEANFIDQSLVAELGIPTRPLPTPMQEVSLCEGLIAHVSHTTEPLLLTLSGNHSETISLNVISFLQTPLILGQP